MGGLGLADVWDALQVELGVSYVGRVPRCFAGLTPMHCRVTEVPCRLDAQAKPVADPFHTDHPIGSNGSVPVSVLQAIERKTNPADVTDTESAFTFLDDTDSTSDHHGWEVSRQRRA